MRAVMYDEFQAPPRVVVTPDPGCPAAGVVIAVEATGLCRSDWHGWMGHDPDIRLPHVPGHELAGHIVAVGPSVRGWRIGDRVTTPFVLACGTCATCRRGDQQVCERQRQPGFTDWGSFAELVAIDRAALNLVAVPEELDLETAASLGCRFGTAYRAVVQVAQVQRGERVVVHGCGGVGLSVVMIAASRGADVIAVDVAAASLELAHSVGASMIVDPSAGAVAPRVRDLTDGGADVSVDALGSRATMDASLRCLRRRGRHVQVGLLAGADAAPRLPMHLVIGSELQVFGSHGIAATSYPALLSEIADGRLQPQRLIRERITLDEVPVRLSGLGQAAAAAGGMTVIRPRQP